jgi:predicted enzyme related to lactoylglutathione lyase
MDDAKSVPLFQMVDAVQFYVPDIEAGVRYYGDILGHEIIRKTESAVGLRLSGSEAEIVIQNERDYQEIDLSVESANAAARRIEDAGGKIIVPPFDIQIGRAVVEDTWGNRMVLFDSSKGHLVTDADGIVTGVE